MLINFYNTPRSQDNEESANKAINTAFEFGNCSPGVCISLKNP